MPRTHAKAKHCNHFWNKVNILSHRPYLSDMCFKRAMVGRFLNWTEETWVQAWYPVAWWIWPPTSLPQASCFPRGSKRSSICLQRWISKASFSHRIYESSLLPCTVWFIFPLQVSLLNAHFPAGRKDLFTSHLAIKARKFLWRPARQSRSHSHCAAAVSAAVGSLLSPPHFTPPFYTSPSQSCPGPGLSLGT